MLNTQRLIETDPGYWERERYRGREKYRRLNYKDKYTKKSHPILTNLHRKLSAKGLIKKQQEAHHWNYNLPYDVFVLDRRTHSQLHQLIRRRDDGLFETKEGVILQTADDHENFIKSAFNIDVKRVVIS